MSYPMLAMISIQQDRAVEAIAFVVPMKREKEKEGMS
jgi:hypothetical protein